MTMKLRPSIVVGAAAAMLLWTVSATAQSSSQVPDRFRVEVGGFRIGSDTELTFNTSGTPKTPVDFENLDLPDRATRFYVEGFWRPWRRHQFSLSWYQNNREGDPQPVARDFTWGDRVVSAGGTATARVTSHYLSGVYRFAAYKSDRFEVGPSIGIGHFSLDAGISGQVSGTGAVGTAPVPFDVSKGISQPTADLGGYACWWPIPRLLVRGDARYILVKPERSEASVTDARAAALYHLWPKFGVGVQYTYTKFRYDRDVLSRELGGRLRYSGGQLVVAGAF
jgi:hypothetical protein